MSQRASNERVPMGSRSRRAAAMGIVLALLWAVALPEASSASSSSSIDLAEPESAVNPDPWEGMNRGTFWFNEKADIYVLAPVARGWRWLTPGILRTAISNFNNLLLVPGVFANNVLQLKPGAAAYDVLRLAYNATLGIGGLIDVASAIDIPRNEEDFGQTLGYWGTPEGPYLVLPFFGPSNVRDAFGRLGDAAGTYYLTLLPYWSTLLVRGIDVVNVRAYYLEEIDENRRESFDYYVFMRSAYLQNRRTKVGRARGEEAAPGSSDEDLYYFDDEEIGDLEEERGEAREGPNEGPNEGANDGAK